jgi:hypothetical protein
MHGDGRIAATGTRLADEKDRFALSGKLVHLAHEPMGGAAQLDRPRPEECEPKRPRLLRRRAMGHPPKRFTARGEHRTEKAESIRGGCRSWCEQETQQLLSIRQDRCGQELRRQHRRPGAEDLHGGHRWSREGFTAGKDQSSVTLLVEGENRRAMDAKLAHRLLEKNS